MLTRLQQALPGWLQWPPTQPHQSLTDSIDLEPRLLYFLRWAWCMMVFRAELWGLLCSGSAAASPQSVRHLLIQSTLNKAAISLLCGFCNPRSPFFMSQSLKFALSVLRVLLHFDFLHQVYRLSGMNCTMTAVRSPILTWRSRSPCAAGLFTMASTCSSPVFSSLVWPCWSFCSLLTLERRFHWVERQNYLFLSLSHSHRDCDSWL